MARIKYFKLSRAKRGMLLLPLLFTVPCTATGPEDGCGPTLRPTEVVAALRELILNSTNTNTSAVVKRDGKKCKAKSAMVLRHGDILELPKGARAQVSYGRSRIVEYKAGSHKIEGDRLDVIELPPEVRAFTNAVSALFVTAPVSTVVGGSPRTPVSAQIPKPLLIPSPRLKAIDLLPSNERYKLSGEARVVPILWRDGTPPFSAEVDPSYSGRVEMVQERLALLKRLESKSSPTFTVTIRDGAGDKLSWTFFSSVTEEQTAGSLKKSVAADSMVAFYLIARECGARHWRFEHLSRLFLLGENDYLASRFFDAIAGEELGRLPIGQTTACE